MAIIFTHPHLGPAQIVFDTLERAGFHPSLRNEHVARLIGVVPVHENLIEVVVPDEEASSAVEALRELGFIGRQGELSIPLAEDGALSIQENCPHCGAETEPGFETCWSCGKDLVVQEDGGVDP